MNSNKDILTKEVNEVMSNAHKAFRDFSRVNHFKRADFLRAIASEIEALGDNLIETASAETNLTSARLAGERARTCNQLRLFANYLEKGEFLRISIDKGDPGRQPSPKPDIRKMMTGVGPVVVFGAGNFPLAFSTAGGDTASALAAGCTVVVKAHHGHPATSSLVARAITQAAQKTNMPDYTFQHIENTSYLAGELLVKHPSAKAVGFTGSQLGGMALHKYASERAEPIPVFAEMGSTNPVFIFPAILQNQTKQLAAKYAASITLGCGQFCTKPGVIFGIDSAPWEKFIKLLAENILRISAAPMLSKNIQDNFIKGVSYREKIEKLELVSESISADSSQSGYLHRCSLNIFESDGLLKEEVFGPYCLLVTCNHLNDYHKVLSMLPGQLTLSLAMNEEDLKTDAVGDLLREAQAVAGRLICNDVPTGVEVCESVIHGGPYPATTDSRFTSVGTDAIFRWLRPICYQNTPEELLPEELKSDNPLGLPQKWLI